MKAHAMHSPFISTNAHDGKFGVQLGIKRDTNAETILKNNFIKFNETANAKLNVLPIN